MEKALESSNPKTTTIVTVTAAQLRVIADRLDEAARHALPGQEISYDFTRTITFRYDPEVSLSRMMGVLSLSRVAEFAASRIEGLPDPKLEAPAT